MAGVTLIELIVTLGLLAIVALGILGFYLNGIQSGQHAKGLAVAAGLAQARLETIRSGSFSEVINAAGEPSATTVYGYAEKVEVSEVAPGARQITVTIVWTWRGQKRETTLTSIVMEPELQ